jgi:lipopolysaccharide assembly outer membrane protein LptD (OstA)
MKANGGKIRFIQKLYSEYNSSMTLEYNYSYTPNITTVIDNNNKINNNKIKELFVSFWKSYPHVRKSKKKEAESNYKKNDISDSDVAFEIKLLSRELTF